MKNGQKPLSARATGPAFDTPSHAGDLLHIPEAVKAAALEKGFELRWLDYKRLADNHGYHPSGWVPVTKNEFGKLSESVVGAMFGATPDSFERRGSLILGKRSIEEGDKFRAMVRQKNDRLKCIAKIRRDELRESAERAGVETVIDDRADD